MNRARKPPPRKRAYHHGDLKDQLVAATEAIILERGVDGFTLREAARRAGVSPAAPAHHFKDARGLLTEVAMRGFKDFGDALAEADAKGGDDPARRLREQGFAYVRFAMKNPARFQLMFRHAKLDPDWPGFAATAGRSFSVLEGAIRTARRLTPGDALDDDANGMLMAVWSIVHGFAHLALDGQFDFAAGGHGGKRAVLEKFLPLTLKYLPASS